MEDRWEDYPFYTAYVEQWEGKENKAAWCFHVGKQGRSAFTVALANDLLTWANKAYEDKFAKKADFNRLRLDMTYYIQNTEYVLDDGVSHPERVIGKRRIGKYNKDKNRLLILEDDIPVYENNNGRICRDWAALADCLM